MAQTYSIEDVADKIEANVNQNYARVFLPTMLIMKKSLCDGSAIKTSFQNSPISAGIRSNKVLFEFFGDPKNEKPIHLVVHETVKDRLEKTINAENKSVDNVDHWFFVYHPDNKWHGAFATQVKNSPLDKRFCGLSDQIDTVVVFMKLVRQAYEKSFARTKRPIKLHLLIPTNRRLVIEEAIKFPDGPDGLGDFVIEAPGRGLVQLSIPSKQYSRTKGIASYMGDAKHRELGMPQ